ncbi:MAG: hypothetical protein GWP22_08215 [Actinomycetales bacterium]|nr:hypothetical protein [Actinomycetota bacterium]MBT5806298.1 hypothetical protein [Actinomycetota bacterium]NCG03423.1 hypothetical protein [Actinomycetales bacterium]
MAHIMTVDFERNLAPIGQCAFCGGESHTFYNCSSGWCRELTLACDSCVARGALSLNRIHA